MKYEPDRHHRCSIRLPASAYDYAGGGAYFVTVCAHQRQSLFGQVVGGEVRLSEVGEIVAEEWVRTGEIRDNVELDVWVVMPNHFHGILLLIETGGGMARHAPTPTSRQFGQPIAASLPTIIGAFKSAVTKRANALRGTPGAPIWQRNYYEHVIRDEDDLHVLRRYVATNPARWREDDYHPTRL